MTNQKLNAAKCYQWATNQKLNAAKCYQWATKIFTECRNTSMAVIYHIQWKSCKRSKVVRHNHLQVYEMNLAATSVDINRTAKFWVVSASLINETVRHQPSMTAGSKTN